MSIVPDAAACVGIFAGVMQVGRIIYSNRQKINPVLQKRRGSIVAFTVSCLGSIVAYLIIKIIGI